ncbi:hypothetical protein LOE02_03850 [Enterococcus faecalis]
MIKFKVFDVGDIHYEEQIEQFQKEHQNAEFVQITGGYTSYEKIWFKYDDCIEQSELNENQQIVLDWLKSDDHSNYSNIFDLFSDLLEYQVPTKVGEAFTEMMTDKKQQIQVLQAFSCWAIEQEEE